MTWPGNYSSDGADSGQGNNSNYSSLPNGETKGDLQEFIARELEPICSEMHSSMIEMSGNEGQLTIAERLAEAESFFQWASNSFTNGEWSYGSFYGAQIQVISPDAYSAWDLTLPDIHGALVMAMKQLALQYLVQLIVELFAAAGDGPPAGSGSLGIGLSDIFAKSGRARRGEAPNFRARMYRSLAQFQRSLGRGDFGGGSNDLGRVIRTLDDAGVKRLHDWAFSDAGARHYRSMMEHARRGDYRFGTTRDFQNWSRGWEPPRTGPAYNDYMSGGFGSPRQPLNPGGAPYLGPDHGNPFGLN